MLVQRLLPGIVLAAAAGLPVVVLAQDRGLPVIARSGSRNSSRASKTP